MTVYNFSDELLKSSIMAAFDPFIDELRVEAYALEVTIRPATNGVSITTPAGTLILPITMEELWWNNTHGNISTLAGWIKIGDNTPEVLNDSGDNQNYGDLSNGNLYFGLSGNDTYTGGEAGDLVYGNKGDDRLFGYGGSDTMYGGQGADIISGQTNAAGQQLIYGNLDADTLIGGSKADTFYGGQGDDWIKGEAGADIVYANKGNDTISGLAGGDLIYGGQGADFINESGDTVNNVIYGNLDADTIATGQKSDTVYGGQGMDAIFSQSVVGSSPLLRGNRDRDLIYSGTGSDIIEGGPGADTLVSGSLGASPNTISGGTAADVIIGATNAKMNANGDDGNDALDNRVGGKSTLLGGAGNDILTAGRNGDYLHGGPGDDTLNGGQSIFVGNALYGGTGADRLKGGVSSKNILQGGPDNDTLTAGLGGTEKMAGNAGSDLFIWDSHYALATQFQIKVKTTLPLSQVPGGYVGSQITGKTRLLTYRAGIDSVQGFGAGDQLQFNLAAMLNSTLNLLKGVQSNVAQIQNFTQTANGNQQITLAGMIGGKFAGTAALLARLKQVSDPGFLQEYYGFAVNSAATKLWIFQALNTAGDAIIDQADVIYTLKVSGVTASDIILI